MAQFYFEFTPIIWALSNCQWINMNAHKTKHANNNLNHADYLLAFAQYYPNGANYYVFGGMYKVEKILPEVFHTTGIISP